MMGALADAALEEKGRVVGVIPRFMVDIEWGHERVSEMKIVDDMHVRKSMMIEGVDGVIALPGGCGTLEELLEVITLKRLGLYLNPIVIMNIRGFFDPLIQMLNRCVSERFMDDRHSSMWSTAATPLEVLEAMERAPRWPADSLKFASI